CGCTVDVDLPAEALGNLSVAPLRVVEVEVCTEVLAAIAVPYLDSSDPLIAGVGVDIVPEVDKHIVEDGLPGKYATSDEDVGITDDVVVKTGLDRSTKEVLPVGFLLAVISTINKVVDALESLVRPCEGDKGGQWALRIFLSPEQTGPVDETVVVVIDLISGSSSFVGHVFFGLVNIVVVEVRI